MVAFVEVPLVLDAQGVLPLGLHTDLLLAVGILAHVRDYHDLLLHEGRRRLVNSRASSVVIVDHRLLLLVCKRVRLRLLYSKRWGPDALDPHVILLLIFHVVLEVTGRGNEV